MDRHEREARIAIILVSLPLPPMPVLACRGEDATDGVCSSHDLHAVMITTDMQRASQDVVTTEQNDSRKLQKGIVLNAMSDRLHQTLLDADNLESVQKFEKCYEILCDALRTYWALYAHECTDVRICGLHSVLQCDVVYTHILAYVRANLGVEPGASDMQSYAALLKLWLRLSFVY
jgi:hypothetical protein